MYSSSHRRILSEVATNFPTNLDEVTMIAEPGGVRLRNYVDDEGIIMLLKYQIKTSCCMIHS